MSVRLSELFFHLFLIPFLCHIILTLALHAEWLVELKFLCNQTMLNAFSIWMSIATSDRPLARRSVREGSELERAALSTWKYDILGVAFACHAPTRANLFAVGTGYYRRNRSMTQRGHEIYVIRLMNCEISNYGLLWRSEYKEHTLGLSWLSARGLSCLISKI